ncbi:hypothetical protein LINPERHAP1_LOCUS25433 [Linum perenne]
MGDGIAKSNSKAKSQDARGQLASPSYSWSGSRGTVGHIGLFLLKVAALETVRRVSKSKCPPVWHGVQALQFLCYPPFKWIQRWAPLKGLVQGVQMISRPLLVLSIATALSDELTHSNGDLDDNDGPNVHSETPPEEPPSSVSALDASDANAENLTPENWMLELRKELGNQEITLPERFNEDELRRFYNAAEGDFQTFVLSIKNTIRWRETYRILSEDELAMWSNVVFWHGYDFDNRPCLIVRLGLACTNLPVQDRPRFAQAITCSSYLQHNFPNRLARLLIIRLPPVARVIAQTFLQVLKPVTKKKLRVEGKLYREALSEYLKEVPGYLGGSCTCQRCLDDTRNHTGRSGNEMKNKRERDDRGLLLMNSEVDSPVNDEWDRLLRTAVIGILMAWALVALVYGLYDPESSPFSFKRSGDGL